MLRQEIWGNRYHSKLDGQLIISVAIGLCKYGMLGPKTPFYIIPALLLLEEDLGLRLLLVLAVVPCG